MFLSANENQQFSEPVRAQAQPEIDSAKTRKSSQKSEPLPKTAEISLPQDFAKAQETVTDIAVGSKNKETSEQTSEQVQTLKMSSVAEEEKLVVETATVPQTDQQTQTALTANAAIISDAANTVDSASEDEISFGQTIDNRFVDYSSNDWFNREQERLAADNFAEQNRRFQNELAQNVAQSEAQQKDYQSASRT